MSVISSDEPPSVQADNTSKHSSRAAEDEITITSVRRLHKKGPPVSNITSSDDFEKPLIDTTAKLTLRSKKTERLQRKSQRRSKKSTLSDASSPGSNDSKTTTILDLPPELLSQILLNLLPTDLLNLQLVSRSLRSFLTLHSASFTRTLLSTRYAHLSRSFWLPFPLSDETISPRAAHILRHPAYQEKLIIHKAPYTQHIPPPNPAEICSCVSCLLAWNNLCMILDYTFFARTRLHRREPLPVIGRGQRPEWNERLLDTHREVVRRVVLGRRYGREGLMYAAVLQRYFEVVAVALTRKVKVKRSEDAKVETRPALTPWKAFGITDEEVRGGTDVFLGREGPASFEFPFSRDVYYSLDAYVPARKWSKGEGRWMYPAPGTVHANDVAWVEARFGDLVKQEDATTSVEERCREV
jgi:hypothetical protein